MLIDKSITEFMHELGSASPAPGGGSVAAMAGALGAQLTAMVCRLTMANAKYEQVHREMSELLHHTSVIGARLTECIDEDTKAFNQVMASYSLPKETDEEKKMRTGAIQSAMKEAALLPLQVVNASLDVLANAKIVLLSGTTNAASDAAVAGLMAYAGLMGAAYNVKINLASIKDQSFVETTDAKLSEILHKADVLHLEIREIANRSLG